MKRITRNIIITVGGLLIAGIVSDINFDFRIIRPGDLAIHCFDSDYWDAKYEKSLNAKLQPDVKGIDVSHHNGSIRWDILAEKDHIQFVYIKATEGATIVDNMYAKNTVSAKDAGILVGAYHFLTTASSAEKQFENFKAAVNTTRIDLLPVLDAEKMSINHPMTKKEYVKHVRKWVDLCKKEYGKAPIIYCSQEHYRTYFKSHFKDCPFWCGDVGATRKYVDREKWIIWQKTIRKLKGTSGSVDLNVLAPEASLEDILLCSSTSDTGIDVSHH